MLGIRSWEWSLAGSDSLDSAIERGAMPQEATWRQPSQDGSESVSRRHEGVSRPGSVLRKRRPESRAWRLAFVSWKRAALHGAPDVGAIEGQDLSDSDVDRGGVRAGRERHLPGGGVEYPQNPSVLAPWEVRGGRGVVLRVEGRPTVADAVSRDGPDRESDSRPGEGLADAGSGVRAYWPRAGLRAGRVAGALCGGDCVSARVPDCGLAPASASF